MSNNNSNIKSSFTLVAFNKQFSRLQIGEFTNPTTGDTFKSLIFTDAQGEKTFVGFSQNLGELSPAQLKAQKDSLQVVQLESGSYKLCKQGENTWEDVEL